MKKDLFPGDEQEARGLLLQMEPLIAVLVKAYGRHIPTVDDQRDRLVEQLSERLAELRILIGLDDA